MYLVGDMDTLSVLDALTELRDQGFQVIDAVNRNPLCDSHNPLNLDYIDDNKRYHVCYKIAKLASEL